MQDPVTISGVHLKRIGDYAIVAVEVDGQWVDVIKEFHDGNFSHIVEPNGIRRCMEKQTSGGSQ